MTSRSRDIVGKAALPMAGRTREGVSAAILDAAYRCLARHGYAAVSMRQIAREAGVALSQLHYYFRSKEHLLIEVMRRTTEQHVREMAGWLAHQAPERRLYGLLSMVRARLRKDPGWFRLLFDCVSLAFRDAEARNQLRRVFQEVADEAALRLVQLWQPSQVTLAGGTGSWSARLSPQTLGRIFAAALYGLALQLLLERDEATDSEPAWFEEILAAAGTP